MRSLFPEYARMHLVAPVSSRRVRTRFHTFVACVGAALAAAVVVTAIASPIHDMRTLAVLAFLTVVAEHRDRLFGDETSMSGSIVVVMAAVVTFAGNGLLGPFLCGAVAGLYWPHLRDRAWSKIIVNGASIGFSSLSACALFGSIEPNDPSVPTTLLLSVPAVLLYWLVNSAVLAAAMTLLERGQFRATFANLIRSETQMIFFALLGGLCGLLVLEVGLWEGAAALVGVLVAVDVLVIGRPRPFTVRMQHPGLMARFTQAASICGAGVAAYLAADPLGPVAAWLAAIAFGAGTTFVATALALRPRVGAWDAPLALGVVMGDAPLIVVAAVAGCVAGAVGPVPALVVGIVASASVLLGWAWQQRRSAPEPVDDVAALAILELALAERREGSTGD